MSASAPPVQRESPRDVHAVGAGSPCFSRADCPGHAGLLDIRPRIDAKMLRAMRANIDVRRDSLAGLLDLAVVQEWHGTARHSHRQAVARRHSRGVLNGVIFMRSSSEQLP